MGAGLHHISRAKAIVIREVVLGVHLGQHCTS